MKNGTLSFDLSYIAIIFYYIHFSTSFFSLFFIKPIATLICQLILTCQKSSQTMKLLGYNIAKHQKWSRWRCFPFMLYILQSIHNFNHQRSQNHRFYRIINYDYKKEPSHHLQNCDFKEKDEILIWLWNNKYQHHQRYYQPVIISP